MMLFSTLWISSSSTSAGRWISTEARSPVPAFVGHDGQVADLVGEREVERLVELVVGRVRARPGLGELEAGAPSPGAAGDPPR